MKGCNDMVYCDLRFAENVNATVLFFLTPSWHRSKLNCPEYSTRIPDICLHSLDSYTLSERQHRDNTRDNRLEVRVLVGVGRTQQKFQRVHLFHQDMRYPSEDWDL
jgi:hypothetical protein